MLTESNQSLVREEISDEMIVVDAKATPLLTMIPKGPRPEAHLFEQPVDEYDDPKTDGRPDGKDLESSEIENAAENRQKLGARTQWFLRGIGVGKMAAQQTVAGIGKAPNAEYASAMKKKTVELKRDIELRTVSILDSGNPSTGNVTRGLGKWIDSAAQADQPVHADYRTPAAAIKSVAAITDLTEADVKDVLRAMWGVCGEKKNYKMPVTAALQDVFTGFTLTQPNSETDFPVRRFNQDGMGSKIKHTVDMYEGDLGILEIFPHPFMNPEAAATLKQHGYCLLMSLLAYRPMQMPTHEELPNGGGGRRGQVDAILGLVHKNPKLAGKFKID